MFLLEEELMKKTDPQGYAEKVRQYKESEKLARSKEGKHDLKRKCVIM